MSLRSSFLAAMATLHFATVAGTLSREIAGTERDVLVPRLDPQRLPATTPDGREVPTRFAYQLENALRALRDRGQLPDHAHLRWSSILHGLTALASFDGHGDGAWCTLESWAYRAGLDEGTCTAVQQWAVEAGLMDVAPRWRRADRTHRARRSGSATETPCTRERSTVRFLYLVPLAQARGLDQAALEALVLDVIALPRARPAPVVDQVDRGQIPLPLADTPPLPRRAPRRAPTVDELPPELRGILKPLAELAELTTVRLPGSYVLELAMGPAVPEARRLEHPVELVKALSELVRDVRAEIAAASAAGETAPRWSSARVGRLLGRYISSKVDWLLEGPGALRARQEAAVREADYHALKLSETRASIDAARRPLQLDPATQRLVNDLRRRYLFSDDTAERDTIADRLEELGQSLTDRPAPAPE